MWHLVALTKIFPSSHLLLALLCIHWLLPPLQQWLHFSGFALDARICRFKFIFTKSKLLLEFTWGSSQEKWLRTSKHSLEHQCPLGSGRNRTPSQYVASKENHEPLEYPSSWTGKSTLALDSYNTLTICEQKTSKATESQSPSSLSWQSTVVVIETGAVRVAPPSTSKTELGDAAPQREVQRSPAPSEQCLLSARSPGVMMLIQLYQQINTGLAKAKSILEKNICDIALAA